MVLLGRAHDSSGWGATGGPRGGSLLGRGSIVSVQRTSVSTGSPSAPSHECVFTIAVTFEDGVRYTATCRQSVRADLLASLMRAGAAVAVRVDPADRSRIELSFDEPVPTTETVTAGDQDTQAPGGADRRRYVAHLINGHIAHITGE